MGSIVALTKMIYIKNNSHFPLDGSNPLGRWNIYRLAYIKSCRIYFHEICFKMIYENIHRNMWQGDIDQDRRVD